MHVDLLAYPQVKEWLSLTTQQQTGVTSFREGHQTGKANGKLNRYRLGRVDLRARAAEVVPKTVSC